LTGRLLGRALASSALAGGCLACGCLLLTSRSPLGGRLLLPGRSLLGSGPSLGRSLLGCRGHVRLLGVWWLVCTTGRLFRDRLSDITAAFGHGDASCHRQHVDPSTNGIEAVHGERTRFAEIQYLPRTARWWIPQLTQGDIALRVAGVDVCA